MKLLVTRTDKLGDLVLALPVFEYLKTARPELEVHAMVAPASLPLVENNPHVAGVWTWTEEDDEVEQEDLRARLVAEGFDVAIMLQYRRELAGLLRRAGIGRRHGPLSRISSWFLLNRGSWQARSQSRRHEMEQNLDLARRFLGRAAEGLAQPSIGDLHLTEGQRLLGQEFRRDEGLEDQSVLFLHPGSGGSALDWQPRRFAGVACALAAQEGFKVFITGAGTDAQVIQKMVPHLDSRVGLLLDRYKLREFLGVLSAGDYFVGPSTGPLHLAASLGLGTVGLFPPVRTMSPDRWGPRGKRTAVVVPPVRCPARRFCTGERCPHFNCMDEIFERDVLGAVLELHRERTAAGSETEPGTEEES